MNLSRSVTSYLDALGNARLALTAPSVFVPFAAFGALQCLLLVMLAFFTAEPIAGFMIPAVRALGGEPALHYPMHFVQLPGLYQRVYLPLAATIGFACWSLGIWSMVDHHTVGRSRPRRPFRAALVHVLIVGLVFVGVSWLLGLGLGAVLARVQGPAARVVTFAGLAAVACVQALLIYAPVVLRLRGGSALAAIRSSAQYASRRFVATALVILTILLIHAPVDFLLSQSDRVALRFHPEMLFYLLAGGAVLEMFTAYLLFASIAGLALPEEGGMR